MSPNLREHHSHDIKKYGIVIAKKYKFVHKLLDSAQPYLGKEHRKLFHDEATMRWMGIMYGSIAEMIAREHWRLDLETTKKRNAIARERYKKEKGLNTKNKKKKI